MYSHTKLSAYKTLHIISARKDTIWHECNPRSIVSQMFSPWFNTKNNVARYYRLIKEKIQFGYRGVSYANFGASDELNQGECNIKKGHRPLKCCGSWSPGKDLGRVISSHESIETSAVRSQHGIRRWLERHRWLTGVTCWNCWVTGFSLGKV